MTKNERLDSSYELGPMIGRGTYSEVILAKRKSAEEILGADLTTLERSSSSLSTASSPSTMSSTDSSPDVVAIKRISKSRLITHEERLMPQREIEVHETIGRHPNAVYMIDSYEDDNNVFLVLEMVDGGTLEDKLKRNPLGLPCEQARNIIQQLLLGVKHLHEHSLVHVDISPKNILIHEKTGAVKLCDFGMTQVSRSSSLSQLDLLSSSESSAATDGGVYGTQGYAAPEVGTGLAIDEKADMWSIGMVCYELLTGLSPCAILSNGDITFSEELWKDKSEASRAFTEALLKVNSTERLSIEDALAHPWFK